MKPFNFAPAANRYIPLYFSYKRLIHSAPTPSIPIFNSRTSTNRPVMETNSGLCSLADRQLLSNLTRRTLPKFDRPIFFDERLGKRQSRKRYRCYIASRCTLDDSKEMY